MKRIIKDNSVLHRMIALVMSVVMILTLVAIDSHFSLSAEEPTPKSLPVKEIDIAELIKNKSEKDNNEERYYSEEVNVKFTLNNTTDNIKKEDVLYMFCDDSVSTTTDPEKYIKLDIEEELKDITKPNKYAFYYAVYDEEDNKTEQYKLIGTITVYIDKDAPSVDSVTVIGNKNKVRPKTGYYLLNGLNIADKAKIEIKVSDAPGETASGIDKVECEDNYGSITTIEADDNGKFFFEVPDDYNTRTFKFRAIDKAKNKGDYSEILTFNTVKSKPAVNNCETKAVSNGYFNNMNFILSKTDIQVKVDKWLPSDKADYTLRYKFIKKGEEINADNCVEKTIDSEPTYFTVPVDPKATNPFNTEGSVIKSVIVSIVDEFENESGWKDLNGNYVFVDSQAPTISVDGQSPYWVRDLKLTVDASTKYSYLSTLGYIVNGVDKQLKNNIYSFSSDASITVEKGDSINCGDEMINLPDGETDITFYATSVTGVTGKYPITAKIDTTPPEVTVSTSVATTTTDGKECYAFMNDNDEVDFSWTDTHSGVTLDSDHVKAKFVKAEKKKGDKDYDLKVIFDGTSSAHVTAMDVPNGLYKLVITIIDNAGNEIVVNACDDDHLKYNIMVNRGGGEKLTADISAKAINTQKGGKNIDVAAGDHISSEEVIVTFKAVGDYIAEEDVVILDNNTVIPSTEYEYSSSGVSNVERTLTLEYKISGVEKSKLHTLKLYVKSHGKNVESVDDYDKSSEFSFLYDLVRPTLSIKSAPEAYNNGKATIKFDHDDKTGEVVATHIEGKRVVKSFGPDGKVETKEEDVVKEYNANTHTASFDGEGVYTLNVWSEDKAGNSSKSEKAVFTIDKGEPVLTYTDTTTDPSATYLGKQYVNITIKDAYGISAEDVELFVNSVSYDKEDTAKTAYKFVQKNPNTITARVKLAELKGKANKHLIKVNGMDKAGNSIEKENRDKLAVRNYFIDSTEPSVMIDPIPEDKNDGYYKKNVSFDLHVTEQFDNSIMQSFNKNHKLVITDNKGTGKTKTYSFNTNDYTCYPTYTEEGEYELSIEVTDACGNIMTTDTYFFIDKTKPEVALGSVNAINNSAVSVPMTLTDNMKGAKYKVHVVRTDASGNVVFEGVQENGVWDGTDFSKSLSFGDDGDYLVTVTAEDKAGNKSEEASVKFRIDRTAPVISISGVQDKQATTCTATISIDEAFSFTFEGRSLPNDAISVTITKKTDGSSAANVATMNTTNFSAGNPHSASFIVTEDGEYTITANAKDLAGNVAASVTKTFKVDSKAPIVKVTAYDKDSNAVSNYDAVGSKDNEEANYVDMTLSVEESFFTTNNVKIVVKKDGSDVSSAYFTNYGNTSTISTGSQRFTEDGAYNITITAQDEIGNKAEDFNMVFTVDNTAPEIKATDKLEKLLRKAEGEDGNLLLNAEDFADILDKGYDALWNISDTSVFNVDAKLDGVDFVDFSDLADGYHKLVATVTDELGHVTVNEFEFTYDGTAPRIIITGVEDGETLREPFTMTIGLENEADIISSIVINGNTIDPSLYQANNKYEMQVEEYATYTIEVEAKDKAGNVATTFNKDTGKPFTFKLSEKLSPVILIIIILAVILLLALLIFIIIAGKRKKRNAA